MWFNLDRLRKKSRIEFDQSEKLKFVTGLIRLVNSSMVSNSALQFCLYNRLLFTTALFLENYNYNCLGKQEFVLHSICMFIVAGSITFEGQLQTSKFHISSRILSTLTSQGSSESKDLKFKLFLSFFYMWRPEFFSTDRINHLRPCRDDFEPKLRKIDG